MEWKKEGVVFSADNDFEWMVSHASLPFAYKKSEDYYRIFISTRNSYGQSFPAYVDYDFKNKKIIKVSQKPLLNLGKPGTFDDNGIMFSSMVEDKDKIYMYYIGWNMEVKVSYKLSIGLAISKDGGETFEKYSEGPIMDRSVDEPYFNTAPCVIKENDLWRMWYVSCTGWIKSEGKMEPIYYVRSAESKDGINWVRKKEPAINYNSDHEAIGRPWVIKYKGIYRMWYSSRNTVDYRNNKNNTYKIGYAESEDGNKWIRKDNQVGLGISNDGWDSLMTCYCSVFEEENKLFMLYNGNGFGKSGTGMAICNE
ncbi:MAG: hypothetical protein GX275_02640 [Clostridiales bacterium]|nr:hypothetical protein [Clostridiales bacterium]